MKHSKTMFWILYITYVDPVNSCYLPDWKGRPLRDFWFFNWNGFLRRLQWYRATVFPGSQLAEDHRITERGKIIGIFQKHFGAEELDTSAHVKKVTMESFIIKRYTAFWGSLWIYLWHFLFKRLHVSTSYIELVLSAKLWLPKVTVTWLAHWSGLHF